jgi:Phosphodiester glycosidase
MRATLTTDAMLARLPSPLSGAATRALGSRPRHLQRLRLVLDDGAATTLHVATHDLRRVSPRVVRFAQPTPLERWCREHGMAEAIVGGFFIRPGGLPLGELRTSGIARPAMPFDTPWHDVRACMHVAGDRVTLARRDELAPEPPGDLLQAGPLLVRDGAPCVEGDVEGFSAGQRQFDSDITAGRYPRAALALVDDDRMLAVACDGRADDEAGLTLAELADALVALGAGSALNLDGGGSTSLVCAGRLRNVPREEHGVALAGGRPVSTAIAFTRR